MSNDHQPQPNSSDSGAPTPHGAQRSHNGEQAMDLIASMEAQIAFIKQARSEQEQAANELFEREQTLSQREGEFKSREEALSQLENELSERRSEIEATVQSLEQREADLTRRLDALEQERLEAARLAEQQQLELQRKEAEIEETARSLDAAITHATDRAAELAREREQFEHERSKSEARVTERQKALDSTRAELEAARAELKSQREDAGDESEKFKALEIRCAELESKLEAEMQASTSREEALAELERDRATLDAKLSELTGQLELQQGAGDDESSAARIEALQSDLDNAAAERDAFILKASELEAEIEQLRHALAEAETLGSAPGIAPGSSSGSGDDAQLKKLDGEIAKRDRAIEMLSERLKITQSECESLRKSGGGGDARGMAGAAPSEWATLRRTRLVRYKNLLRTQSSKIVSAKATLAKRQEEYDRLLQKRQELAQAKSALDKASARVAKSGARNKASVSILALVFTIGILGALCWSVSERVVPGTYLVEATIEARHEGTPLTPEQIGAWNEFIESLSKDPHLMQVAADRMKRRGLVDLSTPAAVAAAMRTNLDVSAPAPGRATLTLRGEGADRTRRVLDTFMAALITVANDGRVRRIDNATTAMSGPTSSDPAPLDRPHIMIAGVAWAASSGVALLVFLGLWMRLSSSKRRFDESDPELRALDPSGWPQAPGARG